jgi:hypothetical protein
MILELSRGSRSFKALPIGVNFVGKPAAAMKHEFHGHTLRQIHAMEISTKMWRICLR